MPVLHKIDDDAKLILQSGLEMPLTVNFLDALAKYQQNIKSLPRYASYNEILDFSGASNFLLSSEGIKKLAHMASMNDSQGVRPNLQLL